MISSFQSEWVKLLRRRFLIGCIAAAGLIAVLGALVPYLRESGQGSDAAPEVDLEAADGAVAGVTSMSQLLGAAALVIGAIVVVNEYSDGTLKNLLIRQPRKLSLLSGKLAATALFLAGLAVVTIVVAVGFGLVVANVDGTDTSAWFTSAGFGEIFAELGGLVVANLAYGAIGVVLAVVLRSPAIAIGVGLAWAIPGELLISSLSTELADLLPGTLAGAIAGSSDIGTAAAIGGSIAWIVALTGIAAVVFSRREVAS